MIYPIVLACERISNPFLMGAQMDVFLTGASGYLGGVITEHLLAAGHHVRALARSERAAERVTALGATAIVGDLATTEVLRAAAERADAVVHAAVDYQNPDMAALETLGLPAMLAGARGKPFVYTSTGLVYPDTAAAATEELPVDEATAAQPYKIAGERIVLGAAGVDGLVLRASLVHGRGGSGLLQGLAAMGRARQVVPYVGDGDQIWSAVHVDDLAELFVHAVEKPRPGRIFNATAADTFRLRDLAAAIAATTGAVAVPVSLEQATATAPALAVLARSVWLDGSRAVAEFGWHPERPVLLEDLSGI
ncbi:hypothetical protein Acy02nite_22000 [Actinoplanes cyaneus]|uniref:NAD-dependent epimerase/dehydratase domain-containing protein n=2 Tax=Actinoplanes cyaneus TaxID=52696 RepID=A0A919IEU3_9ACTN|nr:hypothetical protein Acy02nite_22000 [Actinoplanes cyaneus]